MLILADVSKFLLRYVFVYPEKKQWYTVTDADFSSSMRRTSGNTDKSFTGPLSSPSNWRVLCPALGLVYMFLSPSHIYWRGSIVLQFSITQFVILRLTPTMWWHWRLTRACERSGAGSERGAERAKYSRSAERVFIQRPERWLCLAPVSLRYRSHHESRACTNPPRIHLCLQQLTKLSAYTSVG